MFWTFAWLLAGAAALLLVLINLARGLLRKCRGWQILLFASLSCGALSILSGFQMVHNWVRHGDWSALEDVVPTEAAVLTIAVCAGIILNFLSLWINLRVEKAQKEDRQ